MTQSNCRLRYLHVSDLPMMLDWRNHPDIRRWMYTGHEITPEEHRRWYEQTSKDKNRVLLVFERDQTAQGFVNLRRISDWGLGEWGFYVAPNSEKGTGSVMGGMALRYAFESLRLKKLCGEVISSNSRSIRFHQRLGFRREGILREQHFNGKSYEDIHCFGLLAREWMFIYSGKSNAP